MRSDGPRSTAWFPNPEPVEVGDGLDKRNLRVGVRRMPKGEESFLRVDQSGVCSRQDLRLGVVQFIEGWLRGRVDFDGNKCRNNLQCWNELTDNLVAVFGYVIFYGLFPIESLLCTEVNEILLDIQLPWRTSFGTAPRTITTPASLISAICSSDNPSCSSVY